MRAVGVALAMLVLAGCSEPQPAAGGPLIMSSPGDVAVNAATAEAKRTVSVFWTEFDRQTPGISNYAIKLSITAQDGFQEFIWAEPVRHGADEVVARLMNDPVHLTDLHFGSEVRVKPELVTDWTYEKDGKQYGHFTTRALASRATPEQRAEIEGVLAPTPLEPEVH
jgi:uncharacterized protein YegJ (DUF2314 family)